MSTNCLKRYSLYCNDGVCTFAETANGQWVKYSCTLDIHKTSTEDLVEILKLRGYKVTLSR